MRRLLGIPTLVIALSPLLGLNACGEESPGTTDGPISEAPSDTQSAQPQPEVLRIVSQTAAGGQTATSAVRIDQPAGFAELTGQFSTPGFATKIRRVVDGAELAAGQAVYGQVIAIGCDVPPSATVTTEEGRVVITPGKVLNPMQECFAPVTTVAIARVDLPLG